MRAWNLSFQYSIQRYSSFLSASSVLSDKRFQSFLPNRLAGGVAWKLSENELRTLSFTKRRESALTHITARKFPVLEMSEYEELIGKFDCSFRRPEEAEAFERLFGQVVILKTRDGTVIMGGMTETGRKVTRYYSAYTFTLEQPDVEDFVSNDTND